MFGGDVLLGVTRAAAGHEEHAGMAGRLEVTDWVALSRATRNIGTLLFFSIFSDFLGDFDPGELDTRSLVQT